MARRWHVVAQASERLVDWRRLDNTLIGELLMRWRGDGEAWWGSLPSRGVGSLHSSSEWVCVSMSCCIVVWVASLTLLLTCFNNLPLSLPHFNTSLKLLAHGGVLGVEAGRQAGEAHVLHRCAVLGAHGSGWASSEGAGGVNDVGVARQVETSWSVT